MLYLSIRGQSQLLVVLHMKLVYSFNQTFDKNNFLMFRTCDFDGNKRYLVMSSVKNPGFLAHPFALSVFDQFVFWTDWVNGTINRADKRDGSGAEVISETAKKPMDVRVYHRLKQLNLVTNAEGGLPAKLK